MYDGYYSIVTSELGMRDEELRKVYRGLAKIEDSFRVTKTCFESSTNTGFPQKV
ncbi:MAG: hypothetical protein ACI4C4_04610 [Lachnospiraceae bacterium]